MKLLAIDFGERRTGVAVSDDLGITAQGLNTIVVDDVADIPGRLNEIVVARKVDRIILGLPLNMNGTESEMSEKVREFAVGLEAVTSCPVVLWDERMTSLQAERVLQELEIKTEGNKEEIDRIAATLMLQEYMKTIP